MIVIKIKQMKIQKILNIASISLIMIAVFAFVFVSNIATANADKNNSTDLQPSKSQDEKLEAPVPVVNEDRESLATCDGSNNPEKCLKDNPIISRILQAMNVLSVGVGIIVTIMIIIGGIQYSSAGGNSQKVQAAKNRIVNAIIALVAYFFLFAFLQWLVPGGIF